MFKSMTIEEIHNIFDMIQLEDIQEITMIYDHINNQIILNSEHNNYDANVVLVDAYLKANSTQRERLKAIGIFLDEIALLDKVIKIQSERTENKIKRLEQQHAKEFKMIGEETSFWNHLDFICDIQKSNDYPEMAAINIFNWGYIQGKRAERARRKKASFV